MTKNTLPYIAAIVAITFIAAFPFDVSARDDEPIVLTEIPGRPGKTLAKAVFGSSGRMGAFYDVDADHHLEFVLLERNKRELELSVLQVDSDNYSFTVPIGDGSAAGLLAINLDGDDELEFIVAHGERLEGLKKGLVLFANALVSTLMAVPVAQVGNTVIATAPVLRANTAIDLYDVLAFDDDGSPLWHRDLHADAAAGDAWDETRFQWIVPHASGRGATILITDDAKQEFIALSGEDGSTMWSQKLRGDHPASQRMYASLIDGERLLPVLFAPGEMLVLDPVTGAAIFDGEVERGIVELPSWLVYRIGDEQGFLAFGNKRNDLRMISLRTGKSLWRLETDKVLDILPLPGGSKFIIVWSDRIAIFDTAGKMLAEHRAPDKIKTKYSPVYRDLNGDGSMEFVFVSGKKILCWNLESDNVRWTAKLGSFVGGANPVELYDAFYDIDEDGWLDVPAKKPSGEGQWLSGDTGEVLTSVSAGYTMPLIGDWDDNGRTEIFWAESWYEVSAAD